MDISKKIVMIFALNSESLGGLHLAATPAFGQQIATSN